MGQGASKQESAAQGAKHAASKLAAQDTASSPVDLQEKAATASQPASSEIQGEGDPTPQVRSATAVGTTAAQGTKSASPLPAAPSQAGIPVHDNPIFEAEPFAETGPQTHAFPPAAAESAPHAFPAAAAESAPHAFPPAAASSTSNPAKTLSETTVQSAQPGTVNTESPGAADVTPASQSPTKFHDAPDDFISDKGLHDSEGHMQGPYRTIGELEGAAGGTLGELPHANVDSNPTGREVAGASNVDIHDDNGAIRGANGTSYRTVGELEGAGDLPAAVAAAPESKGPVAAEAVKEKKAGPKGKQGKVDDDKVPGAGCFACFSGSKEPKAKVQKGKKQQATHPQEEVSPAMAAIPAGGAAAGMAVANGAAGPGHAGETTVTTHDTKSSSATDEESYIRHTTPAVPSSGSTEQVGEPLLESHDAHLPAEKNVAAESELPAEKGIDTEAHEASLPEEPSEQAAREPSPSKIPKPKPMYSSYQVDEPEIAADEKAGTTVDRDLAEPVHAREKPSTAAEETLAHKAPVPYETPIEAHPVHGLEDRISGTPSYEQPAHKETPAAAEVPPTPEKDLRTLSSDTMPQPGEMTPLTKLQNAHEQLEDTVPVPDGKGYASTVPLREPLPSVEYEDAPHSTNLDSIHSPLAYETFAEHEDYQDYAPHGDIATAKEAELDHPEGTQIETTKGADTAVADQHTAEIAAGGALAAGAAAGAAVANSAKKDKFAIAKEKNAEKDKSKAEKAAASRKAKEEKALAKKKADEEKAKKKLEKEAARERKKSSGGFFGCFGGSAAKGAGAANGAVTAGGSAGTSGADAATTTPQAATSGFASDSGATGGEIAAGAVGGAVLGAAGGAAVSPFASPSKERQVEPPATPAPSEGGFVSEDVTPMASPAKPAGKPPKRTKSGRVDYSAIHMAKVPSAKLREGYNPATGLYDTPVSQKVAPGAYSPLRSSQHQLLNSVEMAKQASLQRKASMDRTPMLDRTRSGSRRIYTDGSAPPRPPPGKGIDKAEVSKNYQPLWSSLA